VQGGVEHAYQRSLPLDEVLERDVLLAYAVNGQPLPPQHGYPLRVIVPGWYGMTHVKWLDRITVLREPFAGYQQAVAYRVSSSEDDPGTPVTRMLPRALMVPPGIPDFLTRTRFVQPGPCLLQGRAWSGCGAIAGVDVSADGGQSWRPAGLAPAMSAYGWRGWSLVWDAPPGEHELCCRASDSAGNAQPLDERWNVQGMTNNAVQRLRVVVR
jgi:sulfane dehydrogenase subunit SoxC